MATYFTSDEHYDHKNIIQFCKRPYFRNDVEQMKNALISNHNEVVNQTDDVWHLGDMFWRTLEVRSAIDIMNRLNGRHFYVHGNHDEIFESPCLRSCFEEIHVRTIIKQEGGPKNGIVLDHFAGRVWHHSDKGSWQLYGHTHSAMPEIDPLLSFDVGVDAQNYYPISLTQVAEKMEQKIARIQRGLGLRKPQ